MNYSTQGYRTNSPDRNNPYNVINSNIISMKGVSQPITAIPIINGVPDYSKRQVLQPEQEDFVFEGAEAVLELPYAQTGLSYMGEIDINGFLPNFNFNTSVIPQTTAPTNSIDNLGTVGNNAVQTTAPTTGNQGTVDNLGFNFFSGVEQGSVLPQVMSNPILGQRNLQIQQNNLDYQRQVDSYKNQYSQPDPIQRQLYSTQEQLRQKMGIQDPLQSQTEYNNAVKRVQDRLTTQETPEQQEQTGNWWDMFNNIDRTHDLSSSLTRAGYGVGWSADNYDWASEQQRGIAKTGNTLATIGAVGNTLLKAGKDFFSGMAAANREQQAVNEYHEKMARRLRDRNPYYATYQKGGQIQDEKILTGGYTTGIPENAPITPTAEVERNEFLLQNDGSVQQVLGDTHEQGGELMDLEAGTRVISDHLKIGGEFSKRLNKDFDLNARAKDTYAKAVEKYRKKIGLQKVLDEYQEVIGKIKDQEETEHTQTREINLSFLAQRVQELEAQKAPLEEELSKFTEFVFQEQESKKKETQPTSSYQDGGEVQQILQTYSQVTGIPYEQLLQEFNNLSQQEQQILLQEILQELQGAQQQQQQQTDPEQLIQAYAQATGTDPNQILQQLQQMSPEQQQQTLAQMEQELQQSQQQYKKGGNVPKYQGGGREDKIIQFDDTWDFVYKYPTGTYREAALQHLTGDSKVIYGNADLNSAIQQYLKTMPYAVIKLVREHPIEGGESTYSLRDDLEDAALQLQKGISTTYKDTANYFKDVLGYDKEQIDSYLDMIDFTTGTPEETARGFDNKAGRYTLTRPSFQRGVVTEEQQKALNDAGIYTARQALLDEKDTALKILGEELYNDVVKGLDKYENADYVIGVLQDQPKTDKEETTKTDKETTTTTTPYTQDSKQQINLPWSEIDQRIPFPMGMDIGRMQSVSPINLRPVNVSVEPTLNEINRQVTFANQMANFAPDSTRAAQIANLVATGTDASNQAITANNLQNAQLNQQVEQFNELQIGAADRMNTELAENYTERFLRTKAALESQQAGWYQYMNRLAAQRQQNQFNRNIAQSMFPNMRLSSDGTITGVGDFLEVDQNFLTQQQEKDKTQTAQKGGTIKDYLRLTMFKK